MLTSLLLSTRTCLQSLFRPRIHISLVQEYKNMKIDTVRADTLTIFLLHHFCHSILILYSHNKNKKSISISLALQGLRTCLNKVYLVTRLLLEFATSVSSPLKDYQLLSFYICIFKFSVYKLYSFVVVVYKLDFIC